MALTELLFKICSANGSLSQKGCRPLVYNILEPDIPKKQPNLPSCQKLRTCFCSAGNWRLIWWEGWERMKRSEILHRGRFMKLHSKRHLTFIYAFIPRLYSIACPTKLCGILLVKCMLKCMGRALGPVMYQAAQAVHDLIGFLNFIFLS